MWRFVQDNSRNRKVAALAAPVCESCAVELYLVEVHGSSSRTTVLVVIDAPDGVSIDDCQRVSRSLSAALDVDEPFPGAFDLEVSSPGLNRRLRDLDDARLALGKDVRVDTKTLSEGRRRFVGKLLEVVDDQLVIEVDGTAYAIEADNVRRANLEYALQSPRPKKT